VRVVARQEDDLAGFDADRRLAFGLQQQPAGDHVVVGDQLGGRGQRMAILGRDLGQDAPGRGELGLEEDAAREPHRPQHVGQRVHGRGSLASGASGR
jgi:hypothetical protein